MSKPIKISPILTNRALAGNTDAQFKIANLYMRSENEDDQIKAEDWALRAAQHGHIEAMYWLGEGYTVYAKELIEADPEESQTYFKLAYDWLKQAATENHAAAILELAGYYRRGDVVEQDTAKSIELVQQAAELGDAQAMRDLACIYEHGLGIDVDEEKADFWHAKAEKLND